MHDTPGVRLAGDAENPATTTITVDGETIAAVPGESIAAALTAAGKRKVREDVRGNPRGLLCGMGACFECRVCVNGGALQRACLTPVRPLMRVETLAYRERLPELQSSTPATERQTLNCDVLIIGAGPAGATAAVKLANAGQSVVVMDERHEAGGQYFKQRIAAVRTVAPADSQYRDGRRLIERLHASPAQLIFGATVWGAFRGQSGQLEICATTPSHSYRVMPSKLLVATGAYESVPPFPGWTLPGVMTTGAAQSLVRAYRVGPGRRVLIAGNGPLNLQLACELVHSGIDVVAVAEAAPAPFPRNALASAGALLASPALCLQGLGYLRTLRKAGVPVHYEHHIHRADGDQAVRSGAITALQSGGEPRKETAKEFAIDAICLGYRQQSSSEIVRALGCRQTSTSPGILIAERDRFGETSVPGVFTIGDGAIPGGAQVAIIEGGLVADAILGRQPDRREARRLNRQRRFQRHLWSMYQAAAPVLPESDVIVCRCEAVGADTLRALLQKGVRDIGSLKRLSRAGMGLCQGRYCQKSILGLMSETRGSDIAAHAAFATQNPIKPVTIADVAKEKPEWQGYVTSELPATTGLASAPPTLLGETDVLIIGAGIIGTATALYLGRAGADVMLVDRGMPNGESSGSNAGSLHLQLLPFDFREEVGAPPAASALTLQKLGIDMWTDLEEELQADFELSIGGGLMLADNDDDLGFLRKKAALEKSFGVETEILSAGETRNLFPGVAKHIAGAAFCAGEGKINPLITTPQLLAAALQSGARLNSRTIVTDIVYTNHQYRVSTGRGVITCNKIVNAAGGWAAAIAGLVGAEIPVRSAPQQMLITQTVQTQLPYLLSLARRHLTMKQTANGNILIGGGWPGGFDKDSQRAITLRDSIEGNLWVAQRVFPQIAGLQLIRSWATTGVMIDGAPVIGELPGHPGFYNVVGANGYTMGPILGRIVADLIVTGHAPLDIAPFKVERFN